MCSGTSNAPIHRNRSASSAFVREILHFARCILLIGKTIFSNREASNSDDQTAIFGRGGLPCLERVLDRKLGLGQWARRRRKEMALVVVPD